MACTAPVITLLLAIVTLTQPLTAAVPPGGYSWCCDDSLCDSGYYCELEQYDCVQAPCDYAQPKCTLGPCAAVRCAAGYQCENVKPAYPTHATGCKPTARCVPISYPSV